MADKNKTTLIFAAGVAGVIAVMNLGSNEGTFSSKSATAEEPAGIASTSSQPAPSRPAPLGHDVTTRAGKPSIVTYMSGEQKIEQSITEARSKLSYFWQHAEQPQPSENTFTLKVAFPVTRDGAKGREHMWVTDVTRNGATMTGRLDNEPDTLKGAHIGDRMTFSEDMITDWGFRRNGKIIGFYSTRVMLDDAPPDEAAYIRSMLGENPR